MPIKHFLTLLISMFLFSTAYSQELPFIVSPKAGTVLPTALIAGHSTFAYYTVKNNTPLTHPITKNFVKYFPPNVSQEFTDLTYPDICQQTFTLQRKGVTGDSCTLKLKVSGPVHTDCDHNNAEGCLFVCMSDKTSCAGTHYPLHVNIIDAVAVGYSIDSNNNLLPLSYISTNAGKNWKLSATPSLPSMPIGQDQGILNGVTCNGAICTTVGYSFDSLFDYLPLGYISHDAGQSWKLSSQILLPTSPVNYNRGILNQLSCEASYCVTVGNFYYATPFNNIALPLGYHSNNSGQSWTLATSFPSPLPSPTTQETLWGVSCVGNFCTSVGQSNTLNTDAGKLLAYSSNDGGQNWNSSSVGALPGGMNQGLFFSTDCSGIHCTAVGLSYNNSNGINFFTDPSPLVYTSNDSGQNWNRSPVLPASSKTYGLLWGVTCTGNSCVAVGQGYNNFVTDSIPTAYTSIDGGQSWSLSTGLNLPSGQTQGYLFTVSCTHNNCISVGQSYTTLDIAPLPLVYTSNNGGQDWTLSPPLPLPNGQTQGVLIGVMTGGA